ncbi:Hpt domain protein [Methyloligella halotolerans]|uniref:Hpt domain protein n=1 Tax=Methyloligella halotolerans TaxID=1177755 RepID=A0A1E2S1C4_9HYPH|nr:Hpt domain-containing protein [Methyloligella halotolerans]ODA68222.1 Hpt domain protein [Methyloligella halotolerans]
MPTPSDSVRRAEAAVEALSPSFRAWLGEEVQALVEACRAAETEDFSIESRQGIYLSAHTLKGQASTLGQPQIAKLAASLCRLLGHWRPSEDYRELAAEHVAAIDGVYRRNDPEIANRLAYALVQEMNRRTDALLDAPAESE